MTEQLVGVIQKWQGLSTDTKATISTTAIDSEWDEKDTSDKYKFDGTSWNYASNSANKPYAYALSEGLVSRVSVINKFGHNSTVAATLEEVWDGSAAYLYLGSAATLYLFTTPSPLSWLKTNPNLKEASGSGVAISTSQIPICRFGSC